MNKSAFFDSIRASLFRGRLSKSQVEGTELLLDVWAEKYASTINKQQLAYCLATAYHETAHTMQPVRETLAKTDRQAIDRLERAWRNGRLQWVKKPYWRAGYFGRGFVQLTHKTNYDNAGTKLGIDLTHNPSRVLEPEISADILFWGMRDGWFTGKTLDHYINEGGLDFHSARRIVNGMDKAGLIAGCAESFLEALEAAETDHIKKPIDTTGKDLMKSTTQASATIGGFAGIFGTISGHLEGARASVETLLDGSGAPDWTPLAIIALVSIIGAGAYFWILRERKKKADFWGV